MIGGLSRARRPELRFLSLPVLLALLKFPWGHQPLSMRSVDDPIAAVLAAMLQIFRR